MDTDHVFYPSNHFLLLLVLVPPLTWEVLEDDAWPENSLLASAILTVILHSSLWALPQLFQQQPPPSNTVPCTSAELFVSLQCCETQTRVPVNLRATSLPGKLLIKQTGDKLSSLHLCSCIQVSGVGDMSTNVYVHLFIRAQETDYCPLPCFRLQWKVKIDLEVSCIILIISSNEDKKTISAYPKQ